MSDAKGRQNELEFQAIVEQSDDAGCSRGSVKGQEQYPDQPGHESDKWFVLDSSRDVCSRIWHMLAVYHRWRITWGMGSTLV